MYSKKLPVISIALILAAIGATLSIRKSAPQKAHTTLVAIVQTASHPALDAAREGFVTTLKNQMGGAIEFIVHNAQGSIATTHAIAQRLHANQNIKAFYAIATPAVQALAALEKSRPIIVAAITDGKMLSGQSTICGVTDMIDMHAQIAMIHNFVPAAKIVAILYSSAEPNSVSQVKEIKKELEALNINALEIGITQESDVASAVGLACRKADALICPTDNMLASAMELVATIARSKKKPLFACHNQAVNQGALAARGIDYTQNGIDAARVAYKVLVDHTKPAELPIEKGTSSTIYVNKKTLDRLGLSIPETLKQDVVIVEDKA